MRPLQWGLQSSPQHVSYGDLLQLWQRADALGYDSAWLFDHFMPIFSDPTGPCFEGWTLLSALAVQTQRLHVGTLVTSVTYRNPAVLAKIVSTLDVITGGRVELGIGAGWFEDEAKAYGIDFPSPKERLAQLDEALQVIRLLWSQEESNFEGKHFTLSNARCNPKPVQQPNPTIWVGGQGEQVTLRIVAQRADGWACDMLPLEDYRRKLNALIGHCERAGRDPNSVRKMLHFPAIISHDQALLQRRIEAQARSWQTDSAGLEGKVLMGTPQQAAEKLMPYLELGVDYFVMSVSPPYDMTQVELYINEVAAAVERMRG